MAILSLNALTERDQFLTASNKSPVTLAIDSTTDTHTFELVDTLATVAAATPLGLTAASNTVQIGAVSMPGQTFNLPAAADAVGKEFLFVREFTGAVPMSLYTNGVETFSNGEYPLLLPRAGDRVRIKSNGVNGWWVLSDERAFGWCEMQNTAAQGLPNTTNTFLIYDTIVDSNLINYSLANGWCVIPADGRYLIQGRYEIASAPDQSYAWIGWGLNNYNLQQYLGFSPSAKAGNSVMAYGKTEKRFSKNDVVSLIAWHNCGAGITTNNSGAYRVEMQVRQLTRN